MPRRNFWGALVVEMDPQGPFFSGAAPNMVDIMLFPFAYRFETILSHFRGFSVPTDDHWKRYHVWYTAAKEHDSIKVTIPDVSKLIEKYEEYADGLLPEWLKQSRQGGNSYHSVAVLYMYYLSLYV